MNAKKYLKNGSILKSIPNLSEKAKKRPKRNITNPIP
jgi:hypothetical protein